MELQELPRGGGGTIPLLPVVRRGAAVEGVDEEEAERLARFLRDPASVPEERQATLG